MKRLKQILIAIVLLLGLAATTTGCYGGKVCQATKVGNHR